MTPRKNPNAQTQAGRNDDVEARLSLLEYQFTNQAKILERIEANQTATIRQIDTLKYVSQHEFDSYVKDASKSFASAATVRWLLGLVGGIFVGVILAIVGASLR